MKNKERGAAAVEAAIVFPLLIVMVFGLSEYAYYYLTYDRYQQAAFAGARAGSICSIESSTACPDGKEGTASDTTLNVLTSMGYNQTSTPSITVSPSEATAITGKTMIVVSVEAPYVPFATLMAPFMPASVRVRASQLNYVE